MKQDRWRTDWHLVTNTEAHEVTGSSATPNTIYPYDIQKLPSQLQKLPGLSASYISGYTTASISPEDVSVLGEVAAVREEDGLKKSYVWVFGVSGSGVYINGPYKYFDSHHFQNTGSLPVEKLFGNIPAYPSSNKTDSGEQLVYYKVKDEEKGPYTLGQLRSMWDNGQITADALHRANDSSEWSPLAQRFCDSQQMLPTSAQEPSSAQTGFNRRRLGIGKKLALVTACIAVCLCLIYAWAHRGGTDSATGTGFANWDAEEDARRQLDRSYKSYDVIDVHTDSTSKMSEDKSKEWDGEDHTSTSYTYRCVIRVKNAIPR